MRRHNDANVLCLSGKKTSIEAAKKILDAFIAGKFEGGRHERRVLKMDAKFAPANLRLRNVDPEIAEAIEHERQRQQENIELIASENFVSPAVHGSARFGVDEQIRRRLSKKTLVWRL